MTASSMEKNSTPRLAIKTGKTRQMELEANMEKEAVARFEKAIAEYMQMGAEDRHTAIRWLLQAEGLDKEYDAGYICYNLGLPYGMDKEFEAHLTRAA